MKASRSTAIRIEFQITDLNVGLLFVFAVTSLGVYSIALAGWSSNSKYPLLGGLRSSAQMISYELSLGLAVIGTLMMAGTLSLRGIVNAQSGFWHIARRQHLGAALVYFCPAHRLFRLLHLGDCRNQSRAL